MHFDNAITNRIPIKAISINEQQLFVDKANLTLELNHSLKTKKQKFLKRITSNLEVEKLSKKLETFYEHDFKTLPE